jgi:hypothetical protein
MKRRRIKGRRGGRGGILGEAILMGIKFISVNGEFTIPYNK